MGVVFLIIGVICSFDIQVTEVDVVVHWSGFLERFSGLCIVQGFLPWSSFGSKTVKSTFPVQRSTTQTKQTIFFSSAHDKRSTFKF